MHEMQLLMNHHRLCDGTVMFPLAVSCALLLQAGEPVSVVEAGQDLQSQQPASQCPAALDAKSDPNTMSSYR